MDRREMLQSVVAGAFGLTALGNVEVEPVVSEPVPTRKTITIINNPEDTFEASISDFKIEDVGHKNPDGEPYAYLKLYGLKNPGLVYPLIDALRRGDKSDGLPQVILLGGTRGILRPDDFTSFDIKFWKFRLANATGSTCYDPKTGSTDVWIPFSPCYCRVTTGDGQGTACHAFIPTNLISIVPKVNYA